jgi:uncharacterized protein
MHEATQEPIAAPRPLSPVAPWWHTALIVALVVGNALLAARAAHLNSLAAHHAKHYAGGIVTEWVAFLLVWWGLRRKRVALTEILGFRRGLRAWGEDFAAAGAFWILSAMVLACVGIIARLYHVAPAQKVIAAMAPRTMQEMLLWIALSCSAGVVEEFVFRGYLLRQFAAPAHALWLGVIGSSLIFGIAHAYQGVAGMFTIGVYGALLCGLAILRRTLRPGMIAHAWQDIFSGAAAALLHHLHYL